MALIETQDLWKTYTMGDEEIHALRGVSIQIEKGEYVAIMGPSGSGKSTLMNLIGCLDTPSKGSYLLNGKQVSAMNDNELARIRNEEIGFVFQTFGLLLPGRQRIKTRSIRLSIPPLRINSFRRSCRNCAASIHGARARQSASIKSVGRLSPASAATALT